MSGTIVPGDPGGIRSAAGVLGETAADAGDVVERLNSLSGASGGSMWSGPAADAFREKLGELPDKLVKLSDSYGIASDALYCFANDVDQLQDEAGAAEQNEAWAEDQVNFRERERSEAQACYPGEDLSAYDEALARAREQLGQAREEVREVTEDYRCAEDRCIASLCDASDAGIENTILGSVLDFLAAVEDVLSVIVTILVVLAIVALVAAALIFTGGAAAFLVAFAEVAFLAADIFSIVAAASLLTRLALGDDLSLSEVAFALLSVIGGGLARGLLWAGRLFEFGPPLLRAGSELLSHLPPSVQARILAFVHLNGSVVEEGVEQLLDLLIDAAVPPFGPIISLPGVLEDIFGVPTDIPAEGEPVPPGGESDEDQAPQGPTPQTTPAPTPPSSGGSPAPPAPPGGAPAPPGPPSEEPAVPAPPAPAPTSPGAGGGVPAPDLSVPAPGGRDDCASGGPVAPGPSADGSPGQPAAGGPDGPITTEDGTTVAVDTSGAPGTPEVTITLPDGTVVTVDVPGEHRASSKGGGPTMEGPTSGTAPGPSGPDATSPLAEPASTSAPEPSMAGSTSDVSSAGRGNGGLKAGGDGGRQTLGFLDEPQGPSGPAEMGMQDPPSRVDVGGPGSSAGLSGPGSAAPGPDAGGAPLPAPGGAPLEAPAPAAATGVSTSIPAAKPPDAGLQLASAKPKMPLGSPLLMGGLAAGGLVGAGAAYVITDARHKFHKEADNEPLPERVGLRV